MAKKKEDAEGKKAKAGQSEAKAKKKTASKKTTAKPAAKKTADKKPTAAKKTTAKTKAAKTTKSAAKAKTTKAKTAKKPTKAKTKKAATTKKATTKKAASTKKTATPKATTRKKVAPKKKTAEKTVIQPEPLSSSSLTTPYSDVVTGQSRKFEIEPRETWTHPAYPAEEPLVLPESYGDTKIVALLRDVRWAYAYWEISEERRAELDIPRGRHTRSLALRIYDVTGLEFDGSNSHLFFDIPVNDLATSWYFELPEGDREYCLDVGMYDERGQFVTIARSNPIRTANDTVSEDTGEEIWMEVSEQYFTEIFRMSGGLETRGGGSGDLLRRLHQQLLEKHWSAVSSGAFSSSSVLVKPGKN